MKLQLRYHLGLQSPANLSEVRGSVSLWLTHKTIVMVVAGHLLEACFFPSGLWLTHITTVMVVAGCWLEASVFPLVDCDSLTQPLLWLFLVVDWRPQSLPMWTVTHSHNHYYGCCWLFVGGLSLSPCGLWLTHITIVMVVLDVDWRPQSFRM